jgi:hypothetical protein
LQDEDPLEWECSDDGRFSLSLLAHGIESIESKSASASALGSTRAGSSKQGHSAATDSGNDELSPVQHLIVNALGINRGLTQHDRGDIRTAYAKYMATVNAVKQLKDMRAASTWTAKLPTLQEVSGIFVSKSTIFENHHKIFPMVPLFPAMQKWLLDGDDAPEAVQVWGSAKQTFGNLKKILESHGAIFASSKKKGGKSSSVSKKKTLLNQRWRLLKERARVKPKRKAGKRGRILILSKLKDI